MYQLGDAVGRLASPRLPCGVIHTAEENIVQHRLLTVCMQTLGAGEDVSGAAKLRDCIVARPGYTLVCADFSQVRPACMQAPSCQAEGQVPDVSKLLPHAAWQLVFITRACLCIHAF